MCNCTELWTDDNCTTPLCPPFNETALELQGTETLVPENYTEVYQIGGASLTIECPDGRTYPNVTACQITHDYSSFTVEEWCLITTTTSSTTTTTVDTTTTEPTSASTTTTPATTTIPITTTTTVVTTTIAAACVTLNCKNGGTCVVGGKGASCSCAAGFSGTFCQDLDVVDYCALYNWPCQNNGTCSSAAPGYVCSCTTLWTGQNCTIPLCPPFNATLLQLDNTETLSPVNITQGYQVANTSLNITCPDGTVHLDVTTCQSTHNYTAFTPIVWCPTTTTSTTSTSTSTTTSIESTTTTEITDITTTPSVTTSVMAETTTVGACTAANCVYGTCDPSGGTCICDSGYSGTACDVADVVDYCKYANPCQNNGTCLNTVGGATCNCTELWTGANCTIPLCPPFDETLLQLQGNEKLEPTNFTSVNQTGGSSLDIICPDGTKYLNVTFCQTTHDYSTFTPQAIWCPETTTSSSTTETTDSSTTDVSTTIETSTNDLSTTTVSTAIISTVTPYIPVTVADCSTNPCYNGGTCISTGTYNYCNCTPGYTGSNCQQQEVIDPCTDSFSNDPCLTVNHTHCVVVNETNYYCQCDYLWGRTVNCTDDLSTCLNVSCE
uniref:EGF-like domain-containing protein n=1 Tax=Plectus sambesii TaxID=2011161 RepID=A0A914XAX6_9BILA